MLDVDKLVFRYEHRIDQIIGGFVGLLVPPFLLCVIEIPRKDLPPFAVGSGFFVCLSMWCLGHSMLERVELSGSEVTYYSFWGAKRITIDVRRIVDIEVRIGIQKPYLVRFGDGQRTITVLGAIVGLDQLLAELEARSGQSRRTVG